MFVYPLATQRGPKPLGLGLGPLDAGLAFVPAAVAFGVGPLASPTLLRRFGPRIVAAGTAGQCAAMARRALAMLATWPSISVIGTELLLVLLGLGQGCAMSPMFRLALSGVEGHHAGAGSGVLVPTQQLAIAIGATLLGTIYSRALARLGGAGGHAFALGGPYDPAGVPCRPKASPARDPASVRPAQAAALGMITRCMCNESAPDGLAL